MAVFSYLFAYTAGATSAVDAAEKYRNRERFDWVAFDESRPLPVSVLRCH